MARYVSSPARHPPDRQPQTVQFVVRTLVSLALAAIFLTLLSHRLAEINWADVRGAFTGVNGGHWLGALGATALSFWAVGHYDAVLHRHFATGLPDTQTRRAGICAIAVGQVVGLGLLTGAILRWRMLPGQSLLAATRITAAVALSFLAGWAVVTAGVLAALPAAPFKPAAAAVLLGALGLFGLCLCARPLVLRLPNGLTLLRLLGLCAVDTISAGVAFYLLCPDGLTFTFAQILPVFLLSLGAGLISGTPGGVGAFEMTMLALLPPQPAPALLAAIVAWRALYYALPAGVGAGLAIRGPRTFTPTHPPRATDGPHALHSAQMGIIHQGEHQIVSIAGKDWLCARSPHFLIGLFDPTLRPTTASFGALRQCARAESRLPVLYQISARHAFLARQSGFATVRIAKEAWLTPASFNVAATSRTGLRRKLRGAQAAGITVTTPHTDRPVPWRHLDDIAQRWAASHGGERGFSMGRYTRAYVSKQAIFIAWHQNKPVAFVTFHQTADEWALDLMRHGPDPADGIMHLLIHTAIATAADRGVIRLSLAAVPDGAMGRPGGLRRRGMSGWSAKHAAGLIQFKSSFAPNWRVVYLAATSRAALAFACAEIARAVFWPKPLPVQPKTMTEDCIRQDDEDYEFASARIAWHRQTK